MSDTRTLKHPVIAVDKIPFYVPESVLKFKTADKPIFDFKMKEWTRLLGEEDLSSKRR